MYDCLYEMNIPCDVIDIHQMEERFEQKDKPYQMIVTPALYSVSDTFIQKLKKYVQSGGVLVSSFKSFVADRHLSVYPDAQPHGKNQVSSVSGSCVSFAPPHLGQAQGADFATTVSPQSSQYQAGI